MDEESFQPLIRIDSIVSQQFSGSVQQSSGPSWDDFVVDCILGSGAYGKVFKVHKKLPSKKTDEEIIKS